MKNLVLTQEELNQLCAAVDTACVAYDQYIVHAARGTPPRLPLDPRPVWFWEKDLRDTTTLLRRLRKLSREEEGIV